MTAQAKQILHSFDLLAEEDKQEVMSELLRRNIEIDVLPLTDEQLVSIADELFLQLDREEASDA